MKTQLLVFCLIILTFSSVDAKDVILAWDQPNDTRVVGYNIYYGEAIIGLPQVPSTQVNGSTQTTCDIIGLYEGVPYVFAATSFDAEGNEGAFSEKIYYVAPEEDLTLQGLKVVKD